MKNIYIISALFFLTSCSKEELPLDEICITGDCQAEWVIGNQMQPNAYKDDMNYWHVEASKPYFTVKGELDAIYEDYEVNGVPLVETTFDSDYWVWGDFSFTFPLYNPFREWWDSQFLQYMDIGYYQLIQFCNMIKTGEVYNLAGYTLNEKWCGDCPYSGRVMGSYSSNTLNPQQSIHLENSMKGDTITVFMKTVFNYDLGDSEEVYRDLRVIIE